MAFASAFVNSPGYSNPMPGYTATRKLLYCKEYEYLQQPVATIEEMLCIKIRLIAVVEEPGDEGTLAISITNHTAGAENC